MAHTTRFGNTYSDREWAEMNGNWAAEAQAAKDFSAQYEALESWLRSECLALSPSGKALASLIVAGNLGDAIDSGSVRFSSPETAAAVESLNEQYQRRWMAIYDAEQATV